jgi:hypothetical protein
MKLNLVSTDQLHDELKRLVELKKQVCAGDPMTAMVSCDSIAKSLLRPKFTEAQRLFHVGDDRVEQTQTLAAVVARVSPTIKDEGGQPVGMLGFFDSVNEFPPAEAVLSAANFWLREQGCDSIVGPIDGDTWHRYRFNIGPDSDPPFLMEPTNPTYYPELFAQAGFEIIDRYHSLRVEDVKAVISKLKSTVEAATELGYQFRCIRMDRFTEELKIIYEISSAAFRHNFLYEDISWEEFLDLYASAKPLIRPELVWFVEDATGKPIGFLFCLIDYYRAVSSMRGNKGLLGKLRFAWNRSSADAVNFKSIAVLPDHRRSKLGGALMYLGYRESLKLGFTKANLCLIRDGNPSSRLDGGTSRILRRYELYQTPGSRIPGRVMPGLVS